ncbi:glycoside hydrolase superfamily [Mycena maculata]|uniref:Glycoside hydrolase superfamily n=1 Tax=Mycena maculata TaxID=230809 RepID=A0AAD7JRB1_9AGAR|nr:glycoside hydrolase superfamily [Mycena maculata]
MAILRMNRAVLAVVFLRFVALTGAFSSSEASSAPATSVKSAKSSTSTATSAVVASSAPLSLSATPTTTSVASGASFPPVGSIPRDYSPAGLERLWDLVGPVEPPPFTTTRVPTSTRVILPSPPPPLYPAFYAPAPQDILPDLKFPAGFKFGVATAAYQVEGAVKNEGKGPTVWDWNSRQPGGVIDNTTGDVVDLQYYLYKEDVARIVPLGVNAHSFSISWARIFPFGTADSPPNQEGLDHYRDLINYHIQNGVAPVATLYHWDTPLALAAYYGGFTSPEIIDDYIHYAKTVFAAFNGTIQTWYTFNEPRVSCGQTATYPFNVSLAPGVNASMAPFRCAYNIVKAHVGAVKAFREMNIEGEISFKNDDFIGIPWRSNTSDDTLAMERHAAFQIGVFSDPIFTTGDWPTIMLDTLPEEYLPRFTEQEKEDNLGSADFFAIDSYRDLWIAAPPDGIDACVSNMSDPLWPDCNSVVMYDSDAGWATGISPDPLSDSWLQATPNTLRSYLQGVHTRWPTNKMYVSEFGFDEPFEDTYTDLFRITEDVARTNYLMTYLGQILLSIHEDGVPIAGAFVWAMIDNAEWNDGLSAKFGIQHVNYTTLERTYKRSALSLQEFFQAHLQN